MVWFAISYPVAAGILALILLAAGIGVLVLAAVIRRGVARLRE